MEKKAFRSKNDWNCIHFITQSHRFYDVNDDSLLHSSISDTKCVICAHAKKRGIADNEYKVFLLTAQATIFRMLLKHSVRTKAYMTYSCLTTANTVQTSIVRVSMTNSCANSNKRIKYFMNFS